jgi:hypothetical protein
VGGAVQTTYGNPDLKWETSTTTNLGFDLFLFKSKLSIVADAYQKKPLVSFTIRHFLLTQDSRLLLQT